LDDLVDLDVVGPRAWSGLPGLLSHEETDHTTSTQARERRLRAPSDQCAVAACCSVAAAAERNVRPLAPTSTATRSPSWIVPVMSCWARTVSTALWMTLQGPRTVDRIVAALGEPVLSPPARSSVALRI